MSAGGGSMVEGEYWPYFPGPGERGHEFIAVPVRGTCMEPKIPEGARVIADTTASPKPGDIVVALHDGEAIVKTLTEEDGRLMLVALQGRPPIAVDERTQIVGVVRYWGMRP
ncbi:MAG: S24 family peptidase [Chloroflexota bacterium]